jgi:NNP family nitrate/nitrite transporter-like MFS transporter
MADSAHAHDRFVAGPIIILTVLVFFNFLSRGLFSPLLPLIEEDFNISHAQAGRLFLIMSVSFGVCMIFSGFISKRLYHRGVIVLYEALLGLSLILCALSRNYLVFQICVGFLGVSAGLYAPSGLASVTTLAHEKHWGKALGIHELGPNLGLIVAPLLVGFTTPHLPWRLLMVFVGCANWLNGIVYVVWGRGGRFRGEPPHLGNLKPIVRSLTFWIIVLYFVLAASSAMGAYSILPTYLISEKGLNPSAVHTVVGLSRVTAIVVILTAGYLVDKVRIKLLLTVIFAIAGVFALLLGLLEGTWLLVAVFFQPMIIAAFFPIANSAISTIAPPQTRNIAFSLVIPFAAAIGVGVTPSLMGLLGEEGKFYLGFILLGAVTLASMVLIPLLRVSKEKA